MKGSLREVGPGRWRGKVDIPNNGGKRKQVSKIFKAKKKTEAKKMFEDWQAEVRINYKEYITDDKTITDLSRIWIDDLDGRVKSDHIKRATRDSYYYAIKNFTPTILNMKPKKIKKIDIQNFIDYLDFDLELSAGYVAYHIKILTILLDFAVEKEYIKNNIVKKIREKSKTSLRFPQKEEEEPLIVEYDQRLKLLKEAAEVEYELSLAIEIALETGLRRSELLGLRYQDISKDNMIKLRKQIALDGSKNIRLKTKHSVRDIPLRKKALEIIEEMKSIQKKNKMKLGKAYINSGYIFTDNLGKPFLPDRVTKFFKRIVRKIEGLEEHTLHSTRHTYATELIRSGVSTRIVTALLGHYSTEFTEKTYIHLYQGDKIDAVAHLEKYLREKENSVSASTIVTTKKDNIINIKDR